MIRKLLSIVVTVMVLGTAGSVAAAGGHPRSGIALSPLGTYRTGVFDAAAAEIVVHDPRTQRLFVVNADAGQVDVLGIADPAAPELLFTLRTAGAVGDPDAVANSVAVRSDGLVAVAVEAGSKVDPGWVVFYDRHGRLRNVLTVGALPDMLTFTPDGRSLLVANEGEPDGDFTFDPEGSVSVIEVRKPVQWLRDRDVRTADFRDWDRWRRLDPAVRVFGPA